MEATEGHRGGSRRFPDPDTKFCKVLPFPDQPSHAVHLQPSSPAARSAHTSSPPPETARPPSRHADASQKGPRDAGVALLP